VLPARVYQCSLAFGRPYVYFKFLIGLIDYGH